MSRDGAWVLETLSGPDALRKVRETFDKIWQAHSAVPAGVRAEIGIASGEIAANIIEHAVVDRPVRIRMECLVSAHLVEVRFIDDGRELDVNLESVRLPDEMQGRGRGLAVARAVLGTLSYQRDRGQNRWTLVSESFSG